jgi:hypothetical protein
MDDGAWLQAPAAGCRICLKPSGHHREQRVSGVAPVRHRYILSGCQVCALSPDVRFSNRRFGVKRFQTIHHCSVDVARGLVLLFGIGTKALVWGFRCQGGSPGRRSFPSSVSWFDLKARFFVPTCASLTSSAQNLYKVGCRPNLAACFALARPYLDSFEHDGTLMRSRWRSEGSPLSGAIQSRRNLVYGRSKDPNHDAVMRIGSEAPKRRTHSSIRLESQGASRDSATSNRYRRPVTCGQGRNCRGAFSVLRSLCRTQNDAVRDNAFPHEPPQGDQ